MDEDRSGFRNIVLKPVMSGDLPYASASVRSIRGNVSSAWERTDQELRYAVEIPGNTLASLYIPKNAWNEVEVTEGENVCWDGKEGRDTEGLTFLREEEKYIVYQIQAGTYEFVVKPIK